jgi:hypothetical protein
VLEILKQIRELLSKGFCKEAYARNEKGEKVDYYSEDACSFCIYGAIHRTMLAYPRMDYVDTLLKIRKILSVHLPKYGTLVVYNDHPGTTQNNILELLDKAIAQENTRQSSYCKTQPEDRSESSCHHRQNLQIEHILP